MNRKEIDLLKEIYEAFQRVDHIEGQEFIELMEKLEDRFKEQEGRMIDWMDSYGKRRVELASCKERVKTLEDALREIRDQDWVENALDPQWAHRIASEALGSEQ